MPFCYILPSYAVLIYIFHIQNFFLLRSEIIIGNVTDILFWNNKQKVLFLGVGGRGLAYQYDKKKRQGNKGVNKCKMKREKKEQQQKKKHMKRAKKKSKNRKN